MVGAVNPCMQSLRKSAMIGTGFLKITVYVLSTGVSAKQNNNRIFYPDSSVHIISQRTSEPKAAGTVLLSYVHLLYVTFGHWHGGPILIFKFSVPN